MKYNRFLNTLPLDVYFSGLPINYPFSFYSEEEFTGKLFLEIEGEVFEAEVEGFSDGREVKIEKILQVTEPDKFLQLVNRLEPDSFFDQSRVHKKLHQLFFQESPVKVGTHEGQRVAEGTVLLGTKLGPTKNSLSGLVHEMGHLLEIDLPRLKQWGWGFSYGPEVEVLGQVFNEPQTYQASLRECRAIALESVIYDLIGYPYNLMELTKALVFMNDYIMVPGVGEEAKMAFLRQQVVEARKSLNSDLVLQKWQERMEYLRN